MPVHRGIHRHGGEVTQLVTQQGPVHAESRSSKWAERGLTFTAVEGRVEQSTRCCHAPIIGMALRRERDPELEAFRDGVAVLRSDDGKVAGYPATTLDHSC